MAHKSKDPTGPKSPADEVLNVIPFRPRPPQAAAPKVDGETIRLLKIADEIDAVILRHLTEGSVDPRDIAGVLSHRLGTLMRHLDEKKKLIDVCQKVIVKQAVVDE